MGLLDDVRRLFADAEVSLVGGREERVEAERALDASDWFRARAAARRLLERAPRSPIGLGLLASACEGAGLDAELEGALAALAKMAGGSPDVWLRLGRVRRRVGAPAREVRDALVRALAWDDDPDPESRWAARSARVALADLELDEGSPARAEGWLAPIGDDHADVLRRRLNGALARRARDDVARLSERFTPEVTDGDGQRALGEAQALLGDLPAAARALARAAILGDDRAVDALREVVARTPGLDAQTLRAVETVATALGLEKAPLWRAALAGARGDATAAGKALRDALDAGVRLEGPADRAAARAVAVAARDDGLLARCVSERDGGREGEREGDGDPLCRVDRAIVAAVDALRPVAPSAAASPEPSALARGLDALLPIGDALDDAGRTAWVAELSVALVARLLPDGSPAAWDLIGPRLAAHARALGDLAALGRIEHLAAERARPVRAAIVGEFNAGKSTFVNALLGMDVAPTGILPTTAVAHVLRYGPDPIARARLRAGGARTVPPERLKSLLAELDPSTVAEVEVEVPFPYLQRVELVDTPGFNAPDPTHARTAMDTLIEGAGVDVAIWLFDANQPLKTSERRVLEAIAARGITLQALLNKADRLGEADLATVLATFDADARSIGLTSWRPPLAFSARRAVAARLAGDDAALSASGFPPVRALLEDELAAHTVVLKERGLRRRAHDVAVVLSAAADGARAQAIARRSAVLVAGEAFAIRAALVDRAVVLDAARSAASPDKRDARADVLRRLTRDAMRGALDAFRRERDDLLAKDDPSMAPYLERRLAEHVESAAGRAMADVWRASGEAADARPGIAASAPPPVDDVPLDALRHDAGAIARGFAPAGVASLEPQLPAASTGALDVEGGLVRAVLTVLAARLRTEASAARGDEGQGERGGRARELAAMVARLAPKVAGAAPAAARPG